MFEDFDISLPDGEYSWYQQNENGTFTKVLLTVIDGIEYEVIKQVTRVEYLNAMMGLFNETNNN